MNARFAPGDQVFHGGRQSTVAAVNTTGDSPRYTIFHNDDNSVALSLLGRVLSVRS